MRFLQTLEIARAGQPRRVLEIAAGDASLCACLTRIGAKAVANDLRHDDLNEALSRFENGAEIEVAPGDCFQLDPAALGLFDLVVACEVIEHVAHPEDLLRHLRRFLLPHGRMLITTPNGSYFRNRLATLATVGDRAKLEAQQFKPDADGHLFLITPKEFRQLAETVGLEVESLELYGVPMLTGHCGLAMLQSRAIMPLCYFAERACGWLPKALRERLFFGMTAVLRER